VKVLPVRHTPWSCHWSVPTLLMPRPYWLSASDAPWSCWNDRQIVVLSSTDICGTCPLWRRREGHQGRGTVEAVPREGAMPFREP
jgi:hypothetical protein